VKVTATIELDRDISDRIAKILGNVPRITVRRTQQGHGKAVLEAGGERYDLDILLEPTTGDVLGRMILHMDQPDHLPLVVADRLTPRVRQAVETGGGGYVDRTGAVHLEVPNFLLHVEPDRRRADEVVKPKGGMGAVGVRALQAMLTHPQETWAVTDVAKLAHVSSGQAHNVLQRLEDEGLMTAGGQGPTRRRQIVSQTELLDWLAKVPAARKVHARKPVYLYAPDPDRLALRVAGNADEAHLPYALTGAAGARVLGHTVVTALPTVTVRVPNRVPLHEVATLLKAEPAESGANVILLADVGNVGLDDPVERGLVKAAPPIRIWLDMLNEPRGEDSAALFREAAIGY
jgi:hypothetical protein